MVTNKYIKSRKSFDPSLLDCWVLLTTTTARSTGASSMCKELGYSLHVFVLLCLSMEDLQMEKMEKSGDIERYKSTWMYIHECTRLVP